MAIASHLVASAATQVRDLDSRRQHQWRWLRLRLQQRHRWWPAMVVSHQASFASRGFRVFVSYSAASAVTVVTIWFAASSSSLRGAQGAAEVAGVVVVADADQVHDGSFVVARVRVSLLILFVWGEGDSIIIIIIIIIKKKKT